jgi:Bacteriophage related domain of unknown function
MSSLNADVRQAFRTLLLTVVQAQAGPGTTFGTTATDYVRTDGGSFIADGFTVGSEMTAAGFATAANNGPSVIQAVTATALTVAKTGGLVLEPAGATVTLMIGLPSGRALENFAFTPTVGTPYLRDYLLRSPQNSTQRASIGTPARRRHIGIYQLSIFAPADVGAFAAEALADACRELVEQHEQLTVNGRVVTVRPSASLGSGHQDGTWWAVPLSVPYFVDTIN